MLDLVTENPCQRSKSHDPRLVHLLGEICAKEDKMRICMLTAIAVHKRGGMLGPGFFALAKSGGRDTSNLLTCWVN